MWTAPKTFTPDVLTVSDMNTYLTANTLFVRECIAKGAATALQISSNAITITKSYNVLESESGTEDDLDSIGTNRTGLGEGTVVILRAKTDHTITVKNGTNIPIGNDIVLTGGDHLALVRGAAYWYLLDSPRDVTFTCNAFQYPAPGTDWTPAISGAGLAASLTSKKVWLPLNFLKVGDKIISYTLNGDAVETTGLTLDCKLVRVNLADPITTTDVAGGGIVQITADGDFSSEATLTAAETVAVNKTYLLEIEGTTDTSDSLTVIGAEVVIRRK